MQLRLLELEKGQEPKLNFGSWLTIAVYRFGYFDPFISIGK